MYAVLLTLHSLTRWLLLAGLLVSLYRAYSGWLRSRHFTPFDNTLRHTTATIAHLQLLLGITLYFVSPLIRYFLDHFRVAVHQREARFFGLEHSTVMLTAIVLITIGSAKAKRKKQDRDKFRTIALWYTIGLLLILSSIPWAFSPLVSRPYLRGF